jgi:hypothetical protein
VAFARGLIEPHALGEGPETMKFFIMSHSLILCLIGYAWFGQASSRSLSKWSVGGRAWRLLMPTAIVTCATLELAASSLSPPCSSERRFRVWLSGYVPLWRAISDLGDGRADLIALAMTGERN